MPGRRKTDIFIPSGEEAEAAFARTTDLAVGAHPDDVELMAVHGILACYGREDRAFSAIVLSNGAGSPRNGKFQDFSDRQMAEARMKEQKKAAIIGEYAAVVQMGFSSRAVTDPDHSGLTEELAELIRKMRPRTMYIHNPADRHLTHVAACMRAIEALLSLDPADRPERLYGCEVWRSLDWMEEEERTILDTSGFEQLKAELIRAHRSQVEGGKRYDRASEGRPRANATFLASHRTDRMSAAACAVDLTPVLSGADVEDYITGAIDRFREDVVRKIRSVRRG